MHLLKSTRTVRPFGTVLYLSVMFFSPVALFCIHTCTQIRYVRKIFNLFPVSSSFKSVFVFSLPRLRHSSLSLPPSHLTLPNLVLSITSDLGLEAPSVSAHSLKILE